MRFEINFNNPDINNDQWFIDNFGGELVSTGSDKYAPFEIVMVEVKDFNELQKLLEKIDESFETISSAVIAFDPPTLYIDL